MNENMRKILDVAIAIVEGTENTSLRLGESCKDLSVRVGEDYIFLKEDESLKGFVEKVAKTVNDIIRKKEALAYSNGYVDGKKAYVSEPLGNSGVKACDAEADVRTETEQKAA